MFYDVFQFDMFQAWRVGGNCDHFRSPWKETSLWLWDENRVFKKVDFRKATLSAYLLLGLAEKPKPQRKGRKEADRYLTKLCHFAPLKGREGGRKWQSFVHFGKGRLFFKGKGSIGRMNFSRLRELFRRAEIRSLDCKRNVGGQKM